MRVELSYPEQWLNQGGYWIFGNSKLIMQTDGNLVIYDKRNGAVKWSPNINGKGGVKILFQTDSNLVVYTASGGVPWATNKFCTGGYHPMIGLQADSNFVVYCTYFTSETLYYYAIWASGTVF